MIWEIFINLSNCQYCINWGRFWQHNSGYLSTGKSHMDRNYGITC